jgi:xanthosine utilization system XapX-like protein
MSLILFFLITAALGVIGIIYALLSDNDNAGAAGTVVLVVGLLGMFITFLISEGNATKQCVNTAIYQKGSQVHIKGIDKPATVLSIQCDDNEKLIRTYEIATTDAVVVKVKEDNLENAK